MTRELVIEEVGLRANSLYLSVLVLCPHQESGLCVDSGNILMTPVGIFTQLLLYAHAQGANVAPLYYPLPFFMSWLMEELNGEFFFFTPKWQISLSNLCFFSLCLKMLPHNN